jgi:hypothetical protein
MHESEQLEKQIGQYQVCFKHYHKNNCQQNDRNNNDISLTISNVIILSITECKTHTKMAI